ncbi:MAG: hypothetical protein HOP91_09290 [Sphingomonas sp.]|nr:hypothetical protein [Sphingomonas sp.]
MSILWSYFWPCFAIGLLVGGPIGTIAYRRPTRRKAALAIGAFLTLVLSALWHGPLGGADRLASAIEQKARIVLVKNDAPAGIVARAQHGPLSRRLILFGPGDDFQRGEAARLLSEIPGVSDAGWSRSSAVPLIVEGLATAIIGFLFGLALAYLVDLRRRSNAQWTW